MKKKTKLGLILILFAAALWILAENYAARAFVDETTAVHVDPASVEDATLAVGTHLIHLSAVTDEIYRAAVESAEQSGQDRRYYKSELGDGAWYDITEAAGIQSITEQGQPVEDRVIQDLFFRYHTRPDGITYDLLKKIPVNIFDEQNPYELWELPELEPLRQQSTMLHERNGENKSNLSIYQEKILNIFFDTKIHNDVTNTCDEELYNLQKYYEALAANQESAERKNMVMDVMGAVDAARRAEVFRILQEDAIPVLMDRISGIGLTEGELPEDFVINAELSQAAGVSLDNVGQSLIEEQADILNTGTTVLERSRFYYTGRLIQEARKRYYAGCNLEVDHLLYLSNIENSLIVEAEEELALLEELLESADIAYQGALAGGESGEYRAGVANRSSKALLKQLLQTQKSDTNVCRIELQFLIQAKTQRMAKEEAKEFIIQRIEQLGMFREVILQDAFADYAQETVEEHLDWLTEQLGKLSNAAEESELESLMKEKTDLQDQRKSCLDENNLAGAKKLEAQITAKDEEIAQEEGRLQAILNAAETTQAQKALAKNALGNATVNSALNTLADNTIADIRGGDLSGMEDSLETLEQMYDLNADAVENTLKDIYQELAALQMREEAGTAGKIEKGAEGTGEPDDADKTGAAGSTAGIGGTDGTGGVGSTDGADGTGGAGSIGGTGGTGEAGSTDGTGGAGSAGGTGGAGSIGGTGGTGGAGSIGGTGGAGSTGGTGGAGSTDGTGGAGSASGTGGAGSTGGTGGAGSTGGTGGAGSTGGTGGAGSIGGTGGAGSAGGTGGAGGAGGTGGAGSTGGTGGAGSTGGTGGAGSAGGTGGAGGASGTGGAGSTDGRGEAGSTDGTGGAGSTNGTGGTGGAGSTGGTGGAGSTDGTGGAGSTDGMGGTGGAGSTDGTGGTGSTDGYTDKTGGAVDMDRTDTPGTAGESGDTDGMADNAEEGEGGEDTLESQETAKWMERIAEIMAEHITADTGSLTENEIHRLLRELLGSDFTSLGNKDKASALIAVNLYGEYTGSNAVMLLAGSMAGEAYRDKTPYVYQKPDQPGPEYAPADALAKCIGYRYIFDDTGKEATLRRGARFYRFRAADKKVLREEGVTESMSYGAQFQSLLYLEEGYLYDTFQCQVEYIRQSDYGVIATQDMMAKAQELFEAMLEKGEN